MLYLALATNARDIDQDDLMARSRAWWNEGARPANLKTIGAYRTLGSGAKDVYIIEADSHDDLAVMVSHWRGIVTFEIHPAFDSLAQWREQGMDVG